VRRLIVCCDGTWATAEDETVTNVRRFANALGDTDEHGNPQLAYYQPGVGTEGPLLARLIGAATGAGLSNNVLDAYHWLATRFEPGDRIAVVGFSRGAYTARSLAGMISSCGFTEEDDWKTIQLLYDRAYRKGQRTRDGLTFRFDPDRPDEIPVDLVAVWDTVGALGVPDYLGGLGVLDPVHRYDFHNVTLNPHIQFGRHAVAMDETRRPFAPTLWSRPYASGQDVAQVWFPGSHQDVGGGHSQMGLSDAALLWMIDEARQTVGLGFQKSTVEQIRPDPFDVLHDDAFPGPLRSVVEPVVEVLLQPRPRAVPPIDPDEPDDSIHPSAYERNLIPSISGGRYRPTRRPKLGQAVTIEVAADRPWTETGLYLDPGEYEFSADGQWRSGGEAAGPVGSPSGPVAAVASLFTVLFRRLTGQSDATFLFARREVDLPWLSLVAVVANEAYERIGVGTGTRHRVRQGGYLYAYANDAWGEYANNQGAVKLTVTKVKGRRRARMAR
jgi:hypothetical protein